MGRPSLGRTSSLVEFRLADGSLSTNSSTSSSDSSSNPSTSPLNSRSMRLKDSCVRGKSLDVAFDGGTVKLRARSVTHPWAHGDGAGVAVLPFMVGRGLNSESTPSPPVRMAQWGDRACHDFALAASRPLSLCSTSVLFSILLLPLFCYLLSSMAESVPQAAVPTPDPVNAVIIPDVAGQALWKPADDLALVNALAVQKAAGLQSDSGFKTTVWTYVSKAVWLYGQRLGGTKTSDKCKEHFRTVSHFALHIIAFADYIQAQRPLLGCEGASGGVRVWLE